MKKLSLIVSILCLFSILTACSQESEETTSSHGITVTGTPTPEPSSVSAERDVDLDVVKSTADGVNIRDAASSSGIVLGQASINQYFLLVEQGEEWNKIIYDDKEAYISSQFSLRERYSAEEARDLISGNVSASTDAPADTTAPDTSESSETSDTSESSETSDTSEADAAADTTNAEDGEA